MSKNEINAAMENDTRTVNEGKKVIRQLTSIRKTLSEIAPVLSLNDIDDEIATKIAEIDMARERIAKRKKALKLIEQLEALEQD